MLMKTALTTLSAHLPVLCVFRYSQHGGFPVCLISRVVVGRTQPLLIVKKQYQDREYLRM